MIYKPHCIEPTAGTENQLIFDKAFAKSSKILKPMPLQPDRVNL